MTPTQDYLGLDDESAAALISSRIRQWDDEEPLRYASLGLMCLAVEKRMLWRHVTDPADGLPCRSFARWVRCHAPRGYSTVYAALRDVQELQDVPAADLAQIPQSSFYTMRRLSGGVRKRPDVLAAAKKGKAALVRHAQEHYPQQHIESDEDIRLHVTSGQKAEILEEIEAEIQSGEGASAGEVVFAWAMNARLERQTRAERMMQANGGKVAHA
jgi:hypothetical protein